MEEKYLHIKGWGIDADPENEPTYPMKKYTGDDHRRLNYERPPLQPSNIEVLHSNERTGLPAVFGTSVPPTGLSGRLRRYAFRFSEGSFAHWLPLLIADRVQAWEAILEDVKDGHVPNIFAERGWTAEWKYNRKNLLRNVVIGTVAATALIMLTKKLKRSSG